MVEQIQRQKGVSLMWLAALPVLLAAAAFTVHPTGFRYSGPEPAPSVTIKQGTVIGKFVDDGTFPQPLEGFMGIPYAVPPVGERRFRHAEPVGASNETIEAYYLGPRYGPILSMNCSSANELKMSWQATRSFPQRSHPWTRL